jgi:GGDEF domain-containing protein
VGIAIFPEDAPDMETLCIAADLRMYNVKHGAPSLSERSADSKGSPLPTLQFRTVHVDPLPKAAGLMN